MQPVKRVEFVVDALEVPNLLSLLEQLGLSGYTVIPEVTGKGERGERRGDEPSGVFKNSYVLTTCDASQLAELVEAARPILRKRGGICLVSDALWVKH
ncbi:MAG: P-II family nitrogen regulator [Thermoflexales bacterium]